MGTVRNLAAVELVQSQLSTSPFVIGTDTTGGTPLELIAGDENAGVYLQLLIDLLISDFPEAVYIKDRNSCFVFANETIARHHGLNRASELVGKTDHDIHPSEQAEEFFNREQDLIRTGIAIIDHCEWIGARWYSSTKIPIRDQNGTGEVIGLIGVGRDITVQKQAELLLVEQARVIEMIARDASLDQVLANLIGLAATHLPGLDGTYAIESDVEGCRLSADPADLGVYGAETADSRPKRHWCAPILNDAHQLMGTMTFKSTEARLPSTHERGILEVISRIARMAVDRQKTQSRIRYLAYNDSLTGLFNRACLTEKLVEAIGEAAASATTLEVAVIELDEFKLINDTLSYSIGDEVLKVLGQRLLALKGPDDRVFRVGGDEFVIVRVESRPRPHDAASLKAIWSALAEPMQIGPHSVRATASVGVAAYPSDGSTASAIMMNAGTAMHRAKDLGGNRIKHYKPEYGKAAEERLTLIRDLEGALERNEFEILYQPQVKIETGDIFAVEALLRWSHPALGYVSPVAFIPLAEETGAIVPIGHWVLKQACLQCKAWQDLTLKPVTVCVNVSPRQFGEPKWVDSVLRMLEQTGLDGHHLEIEITESCLMVDVDNAIASMNLLKAQGISIAIDDFGTGYSNLGALKRFPLSRLKIDRSLVNDMLVEDSDRAIASACISLGKILGLKVLAEGVETEEQLEFLRASECDEMQGYLFSRPVPAAAIRSMLERT